MNTTLYDQMMESQMPTVAKQNGRYSFGVVRSNGNGKRISLSKSLKQALDLGKSFSLTANKKARKVFIAKNLPSPNAVECKFSDRATNVCYNSSIVESIVEMFDLDYNGRVSRTFSDIEIVDHDGIIFAVINIPEADAKAGGSEVDDKSMVEPA